MPWDEIEVDLSSVKHVVEPSGSSGGLGVVVMTLMDRGSVLDRFPQKCYSGVDRRLVRTVVCTYQIS